MDIREIFNRLQTSYRENPYPSKSIRLNGLKRLEEELLKRQNDLKKALQKDFQKPAFETLGSELLTSLVEIRKARSNLKKWMAPKPVRTPTELMGSRSITRYEPKGVVLIIAPWNYPVNLSLVPLAAAWTAGNKVVVKPSEFSPNTSACIEDLVKSAFGEDEVVVVNGDKKIVEQLIELPFDHIFFTGSQEKAKKLLHMTADRLIPVTLELGGKSPVIVDRGTDLKQYVQDIVFAKCLNAGQTCIGPDFLVIHESQREAFVKLWNESLVNLYGNELIENDDYCGIIHQDHFERILQIIELSKSQGARLDRPIIINRDRRKIHPVLLLDTKWHHRSMEDEIFGPVLPVIVYQEDNEWIEALRNLKIPLTLYLFSDRRQWLHEKSLLIRSGGITINNCLLNYCNFNLPFGGMRESGMGFNHGKFGFEAFSHLRSISIQGNWLNTLRLFHPPYTETKYKLMNFLIKWIEKI